MVTEPLIILDALIRFNFTSRFAVLSSNVKVMSENWEIEL